MYEHEKEKLLNKKIVGAYFKNGAIYLDAGEVKFQLTPWGDCCSQCYITDVCTSEALEGATIEDIETLESVRTSTDTYGDVSDCWGYRFITDKGICTVGMRLDHNGYYGGSLEVEFSNFAPADMEKLKDFS